MILTAHLELAGAKVDVRVESAQGADVDLLTAFEAMTNGVGAFVGRHCPAEDVDEGQTGEVPPASVVPLGGIG